MKRGFLLMNTGAPDAPNERAVSAYIENFLADPLVEDFPKFLRAPLVHWIILPQHPEETAQSYASIWTDNGDPMIHYCTELTQKLKSKFDEPIQLGMAHGNPSYKSAIGNLLFAGVDEICLLFMFPQYDISKQHCIDRCRKELKHLNRDATLRAAPPFYDQPAYIRPFAEHLENTDDYILFVYHGLPVHSLKKADPTGCHCFTAATCCNEPSIAHDTCYRFQCFSTSRIIAKAANIPQECYSSSFLSRHRHGNWLSPHAENVLRELPTNGERRVTVLCPAFVCDCLETLEEIEMRGRETFLEAGGESFRMIPCINDSEAGLNCLETLMANVDNWPVASQFVRR